MQKLCIGLNQKELEGQCSILTEKQVNKSNETSSKGSDDHRTILESAFAYVYSMKQMGESLCISDMSEAHKYQERSRKYYWR